VAKNETVSDASQPVLFNVVEKPSQLGKTSWEYVSENGTKEEVLAPLGRQTFVVNDRVRTSCTYRTHRRPGRESHSSISLDILPASRTVRAQKGLLCG
jgi:hypothetical protein